MAKASDEIDRRSMSTRLNAVGQFMKNFNVIINITIFDIEEVEQNMRRKLKAQ